MGYKKVHGIPTITKMQSEDYEELCRDCNKVAYSLLTVAELTVIDSDLQ